MLNTVHKIIGVHILLLLPFLLSAQDQQLLDYVALLSAQNPALQATRLQETNALIQVQLAERNRRPQLDLKSDYILSAGGRRIAFPIGDLFNPIHGTLNQLTGAPSFPTDLENVNELLTPNNFHDSRLEITLPLIQPAIRREVALRNAQVQEAAMASKVLENELIRQFKALYYAHLQSLAGQQIIDSSRLVLNELVRVNQSLVNNNLATRDILYRTRAEIADLDGQLAVLKQQESITKAAMNRLLGHELNRPLPVGIDQSRPDTVLLAQDLDDLQNLAIENRPELKQLAAGLNSLTALNELQQASRLPNLGLRSQIGAQGFLAGDINDQPYANLGVGFSWNLYDGGKRNLQRQQNQVQAEQLRQRQADTERAVSFQTWQAYQRIQTSKAQLQAIFIAVQASAENARIVERRYRNQQALLIEYLDARNQWTNSRLEYNLAYYQLLQAYAELEAASGHQLN